MSFWWAASVTFNSYREYISEIEGLLRERIEVRTKEIGEESERQKNSFVYLVQQSADHLYNLHFTFPEILRASTFVSTYAMFEKILLEICESMRIYRDISFSVKDLGHKGIEGAKFYLSKVCEIPVFSSNEWQSMSDYNKLRNLFAHGSGDLNTKAKLLKMEEITKRVPHVSIDFEESKIVLDKGFCEEFIQQAERFVDLIRKTLHPDEPDNLLAYP